jgi:hypothetical protein
MGDDLPISYDDLRDLFEYLERANMAGYECDCTFALTEKFLRDGGIAAEKMINWLGENGAGCDCEVIMNTAAEWQDRVGYKSPDEND